MNTVPYYLNPEVDTDPTGTINIFNMDTLSSIQYQKPPENIWQEIGQDLNQTGDWVWDGVEGVWKNAKEGINSLGVAVNESIKEGYSILKTEIIFWLGAALIIIWIVAKSGILTQAAKFMPL